MSAGLSSKSDGMRVLRSGDVAKLAGVTVRTLRHYRSIGLLPEPPRDDNGYCSYGIEDLARVLRIKRLASLGFSLEDIGGMLNDMDAVTSYVQAAGMGGDENAGERQEKDACATSCSRSRG